MRLPLLGNTKRSGYVVPLPNHVDDANNISDIPTRASKRWWREHAEVLWANCVQFMRERDEARSERDAALSRVVELEQAIERYRGYLSACGISPSIPEKALFEVLDGHDHQERREPPRLSDTGWYPGIEREFTEGMMEADGDH